VPFSQVRAAVILACTQAAAAASCIAHNVVTHHIAPAGSWIVTTDFIDKCALHS
jgi:hypothetical protein